MYVNIERKFIYIFFIFFIKCELNAIIISKHQETHQPLLSHKKSSFDKNISMLTNYNGIDDFVLTDNTGTVYLLKKNTSLSKLQDIENYLHRNYEEKSKQTDKLKRSNKNMMNDNGFDHHNHDKKNYKQKVKKETTKKMLKLISHEHKHRPKNGDKYSAGNKILNKKAKINSEQLDFRDEYVDPK